MVDSAYTLNLCLISKSIVDVDLSRGVFICASAMACSAGIILMDSLGGHLYGRDKRNPWFISIAAESFVILLIMLLAIFRQLHV